MTRVLRFSMIVGAAFYIAVFWLIAAKI